MQIVLSDKNRELLDKVDTSKFGWGDSEVLKKSKSFKELSKYSESVLKGDILNGK